MEIAIFVLLGLIAAALIDFLANTLPPERKPHRVRTVIVFILGAGIGLSLSLTPVSINPYLALGILTYFGLVAVIDIEHRLILHSISLVGALLAALAGILLHGWWFTLLGGLAGYGVMYLFYLVGTLFAKYRARQRGEDDGEEALGFGDVTISGVLGLLLGWPDVMLMLLVGVLLGGLVSLLIVAGQALFNRYKPMETFTAYGPYLLVGASAILFFRPQVLAFFFH